jgi:hypothetical protein
MDRRATLLAALVLLGALSGCSVLLDDGAQTPTPEPTAGTEATVEPTAEPTLTATATPEPTVTTTPEPTATPTPTTPAEPTRQTFDASSVNAEHTAGLESAGSFTRQSSLRISNESMTRTINGSYAIERDGPALNHANVTTVIGGQVNDVPPTTRYTEGETTYERRIQNGNAQYRSASEPYSDDDPQPVNRTVAYSLGQIARAVVDGSSWNRTGTGQLEGADVTRYDASAEHFGVVGFAGAEGGATLAVDEHGVVRYVAYRFVVTVGGEPTEYVYEAGYTDVGSTTVSEPGWTDET